jgi:hypothetical protein
MFNLHELGWHDFQRLCLTVTREIFGQTVESFLDSEDAGRDGAFNGIWMPKHGEALNGRFVIQCKFTSKPNKNLTLSDLSDEVLKVKNLVRSGRCDCYVLMTNAGVSGSISERVESLFRRAGVKKIVTYGSTWICQQIRENKRLRMLVPRVYGLGDLTQILDHRAYTQAKALLASMREELSKVVLTDAYRRSAEALDKHGFVLLIGEPAAGKTTIASMLSMAALDQWRASALKLIDPKTVVERWNPEEPSQFFWIDDAFGVMQYESSLAHGWNHALPHVKAMLRKGAKIVMTSRDYIYNRARQDLKESAFPLLQESQVVIDVHDLTLEERQQILYKHMKLGRQDLPFRTVIKPHLEFIADRPRFVPETARRLADPLFTRGLEIDRDSLGDFVDKQEQLLRDVISGLDEHSRAALALIYMRNDALESPIALEESEREAIERLGSGLGACITALESLNGNLAQYMRAEGSATWKFKHPTIGDAFAAFLLERQELLGIYVQGTPVDRLMSQITCGDVGLERAVVLPTAFFSLVLKRLNDFSSTARSRSSLWSSWSARTEVINFLAFRCSKEFLTRYIRDHPEILDDVSTPGLFLSAVSEVDLAVRLHEFGLLTEDYRKRFVAKVSSYAIEGEDLYALESQRIKRVFTKAELDELRLRVRTELLPKLSEVRRTWQSDRISDSNAEEQMQPFLDSLSALKKEFADEPAVTRLVDRETKRTENWISEQLADDSDEKGPRDRSFGDVSGPEHPSGQNRSIFDDVDE